MRVNIESDELNGSKIRKLAYILQRRKDLIIDYRRLGIGYLADLWNDAVNNNKRKLSLKEIMNYLNIYDNDEALFIVSALVDSEYLGEKDEEGLYAVIGKDKDFFARESYVKKGKKGGDARVDNLHKSKHQLENSKHQLDCGLKISSQGEANSIQIRSVQFNSDQINTETTKKLTILENPQIISAPAPGTLAVAPVRKKKNERSEAEKERARKFKDVFVEHYEKAMNGAKPPWGPKEFTMIYEIISTYPLEDLFEMIRVYFVTKPSNSLRDGYPLVGYGSSFKSLAAQLYADVKNPGRRILAKNSEKSFDEHMKIQEKLNLINDRKLV